MTALPLAGSECFADCGVASVNGLVPTSGISQFRPETGLRWSAYAVINRMVTPG